MYCDKSKITRIKSGTSTPSQTSEELFSSIFDTSLPTSLANSNSKGTEQYLLGLLKDAIESDFQEAKEDMADCWGNENYKAFVLELLARARKGSSRKRLLSSSTDATNMAKDEGYQEKRGKPSLSEMFSEQMSKMFEQAIADYNIATYICRLPDYLMGDPFYVCDSFAFVDAIQTDILAKFINHQGEEIYNKISQFTSAVTTYAGFLGMIRSSVSEEYGLMLKAYGFTTEIIDEINATCDAVKNGSDNKILQEDKSNNPSTDDLEEKLIQLDFVRSILLAHKQLCELYSEICPGRKLLVF